MTELELSFTVEEGDLLRINDVWWEISDLETPMGQQVDMVPKNGADMHCLHKEDIEKRIDISGELHLVRNDYQNVIDY